jgi:hypothetical protein
LTDDLTTKTDELYETKYKDGQGKSDREIQKAYAEAMGWDANLVENKSGNKAVYYD